MLDVFMIRLRKNENGFGVVEIIIIFAIVMVIVLVSTVVIPRPSASCNKKYESALAAAQPKIDAFNKIALMGEEPPQQADVQRSGDCLDSEPYATVTKTYRVNQSGDKAVDTVRQSLKAAGYKISSEDFGREGCKVHYKVKAEMNDIKIYAVASQMDVKDNSCTDGYPTGISESQYRSQNIDSAMLRLEN